MARYDNRYSQFVATAKVLLPLAALGLLATLFLVARPSGPGTDIPFAQIEDVAREQRLAGAVFAGVTDEDEDIRLRIATARPDPDAPDRLILSRIEGSLTAAGAAPITFRASEGALDTQAQVGALGGLVRLEAENGYRFETGALSVDLATGRIEADGALEIEAPFGLIEAGGVIVDAPSRGDPQMIRFQDGVRLLYDPQREPE